MRTGLERNHARTDESPRGLRCYFSPAHYTPLM